MHNCDFFKQRCKFERFFCVNQKKKKKKEKWVKFIVKSGICEKLYLHQVIWFDLNFFFFLVIIGLNLELGVDHWLHDQLCNRQSHITHSVARRGTSTIIVIFQRLEYWTNGLFVILSCFDYAWLLGGAIDGIIHGLVKDLIR